MTLQGDAQAPEVLALRSRALYLCGNMQMAQQLYQQALRWVPRVRGRGWALRRAGPGPGLASWRRGACRLVRCIACGPGMLAAQPLAALRRQEAGLPASFHALPTLPLPPLACPCLPYASACLALGAGATRTACRRSAA